MMETIPTKNVVATTGRNWKFVFTLGIFLSGKVATG